MKNFQDGNCDVAQCEKEISRSLVISNWSIGAFVSCSCRTKKLLLDLVGHCSLALLSTNITLNGKYFVLSTDFSCFGPSASVDPSTNNRTESKGKRKAKAQAACCSCLFEESVCAGKCPSLLVQLGDCHCAEHSSHLSNWLSHKDLLDTERKLSLPFSCHKLNLLNDLALANVCCDGESSISVTLRSIERSLPISNNQHLSPHKMSKSTTSNEDWPSSVLRSVNVNISRENDHRIRAAREKKNSCPSLQVFFSSHHFFDDENDASSSMSNVWRVGDGRAMLLTSAALHWNVHQTMDKFIWLELVEERLRERLHKQTVPSDWHKLSRRVWSFQWHRSLFQTIDHSTELDKFISLSTDKQIISLQRLSTCSPFDCRIVE